MLIPSIDLKGGQVVQLIQGERTAIASDDIESWVKRFRSFPKVQLIDLDAAMGVGTNDQLVQNVASRLPCRVGGGIRTIARAREVLGYGATAVIVGSSLFRNGRADLDFAGCLAEAVGREQIIAAVTVEELWKEGRIAVFSCVEMDPRQRNPFWVHLGKPLMRVFCRSSFDRLETKPATWLGRGSALLA